MRNIPVLHANGKTLAEAFENALVALHSGGARFKTQYDKLGDPESIDATMCITVDDPLADPMIHKAFPGGMADLREYVMELEGAKDSWTKVVSDPKDTRWEYTYHGRLARYGTYKDKVANGSAEQNIYGVPNAHVDQFAAVVSKLAKQPFTRQAQMITWVPSLDLECYDPPCLQRIWFRAAEEDGVLWLNFNVSFRSNDAWGAWMMNAFGITTMVNDLVAIPLSKIVGKPVRLGRLNWHADSWHVYGKDIEQFNARLISRIPTTSFEDRVLNFWDPEIQEMYHECEGDIKAKIAEQDAKMQDQDGFEDPTNAPLQFAILPEGTSDNNQLELTLPPAARCHVDGVAGEFVVCGNSGELFRRKIGDWSSFRYCIGQKDGVMSYSDVYQLPGPSIALPFSKFQCVRLY